MIPNNNKKAEVKSKNSVKQMFAKVKGDLIHDEGDLENNNDENYTMIKNLAGTAQTNIKGLVQLLVFLIQNLHYYWLICFL